MAHVLVKGTPYHLLQWQYDLLGGQEIETVRRGNLDGAVFTVQGGQIVIPEEAGGGRVHHVRGAWLTSVEFTWGGYWALPKASPTNYFTGGAAVNSGNQTVITLGTNPGNGTQLQVYYYYGSGIYFQKGTPIEAYPAFIPCRQGGRYKFSSAPDADQWIALAALEARARWDDFKRCYGWSIIESLKEFAKSDDLAIIDDFNRDPSLIRDDGHWTYQGGNTGSTISALITTDGQLRLDGSVNDGGWAYFGWGRPVFIPNASRNLSWLFKGQGDGNAFRMAVNTDPAQTYDLDKIYYYGWVDTSTNWRQIEADYRQFVKIKELIWDGERINWDLWSTRTDSIAVAGKISRHVADHVEDGYRHGQCLRADMVHLNTHANYAVSFFITTRPANNSQNYAGLSFLARWLWEPPGRKILRIELVDGRRFGWWDTCAFYEIPGEQLLYWKRCDLLWNDFYWNGGTIHPLPIQEIRFRWIVEADIGGKTTVWRSDSTGLLDDVWWIPIGRTKHTKDTLEIYLKG